MQPPNTCLRESSNDIIVRNRFMTRREGEGMRYLVFMIGIPMILAGAVCAGSAGKAARPAQSSAPRPSSAPQSAPAGKPAAPSDTPSFYPPDKWVGLLFVLLPKNRMFEKFGYDLTVVSPSAKAGAAALANGRLRADTFAGRCLKVTKVEKAGGEWRVTMSGEGVTVTGVTKLGAIEGLAPAHDLDSARIRWRGATLYAAPRLINTYDSAAARFGSIAVSVTEPLRVLDVRWGQTPLPPKPLWILVESKSGARGFIPVHYSWTNVLAVKRTGPVPWEADVLERDPRSLYTWDRAVWETIDKHNVFRGMTPAQVRLSWGIPLHEEIERGTAGTIRTWTYESGNARFVNDSLVGE
jgi:hypothetical protein